MDRNCGFLFKLINYYIDIFSQLKQVNREGLVEVSNIKKYLVTIRFVDEQHVLYVTHSDFSNDSFIVNLAEVRLPQRELFVFDSAIVKKLSDVRRDSLNLVDVWINPKDSFNHLLHWEFFDNGYELIMKLKALYFFTLSGYQLIDSNYF
jgi:hypothetical protein